MRMNRSRRDGGAVLVISAVFFLVAAIFLAFVVDIGNQRQNRRQLATATDASALAVAQEWATDRSSVDMSDCRPTSVPYVNSNNDDTPTQSVACSITAGVTHAVATVFTDELVDYALDGVTGVPQGNTGSRTSVRIQTLPDGGVRPFTICSADSDVAPWIDDADRATNWPEPEGYVTTVYADKTLPSECQQNNGNWGFIQFPHSSGGANGAAYEVENGAPLQDPVSIAGASPNCLPPNDYRRKESEPAPDPLDCLLDVNGVGVWNNNNTEDAFQTLIDSQRIVYLPVYTGIRPGAGSTTQFPVVGFAKVQILDFVKGSPSSGGELEIRFLEYFDDPSYGSCCNLDYDNVSFEICDVGTVAGGANLDFSSRCSGEVAGDGGAPAPGSEDPPATCAVTDLQFPSSEPSVKTTGNASQIGKLNDDFTVQILTNDSPACSGMTVSVMSSSTPPVPHVTHSPCCESVGGGVFTWTEAKFNDLAAAHAGWTADTSYTFAVLDSVGQILRSGTFSTAD